MMAGPMFILYVISIGLAWAFGKKKEPVPEERVGAAHASRLPATSIGSSPIFNRPIPSAETRPWRGCAFSAAARSPRLD